MKRLAQLLKNSFFLPLHSPLGRKVLLVLSLMGLSAAAGVYYAQMRYDELLIDRQRLAAHNAELIKRMSLLRRDLAIQEVNAVVDGGSVNLVRKTVLDLEKTIVDQREELTFYKGLMKPVDNERGLGVRNFTVYETQDVDKFRYELIVHQLTEVHRTLYGTMRVDVVGEMGGESKRMPLYKLSNDVKSASIKLKFKYFQTFNGVISLPEGFIPLRVVVIASKNGKSQPKIVRTFEWRAEK